MASSHDSAIEAPIEGPATARPGARVPFRLRVRNTGRTAVDLYLRGRVPTAQLVVTDPRGTVVHDSLADEMIPATLLLHTLAPDESLAQTLAWTVEPDAGGAYSVTAALLTEDGAIAAPPHVVNVLSSTPPPR